MSLLYLVGIIGVLNTVDVYKELSKNGICIYDVAVSVVEGDSPFKALQSRTYLSLHIFQNLCSSLKITLFVYEHNTPSSATHQPCVEHRKHA